MRRRAAVRRLRPLRFDIAGPAALPVAEAGRHPLRQRGPAGERGEQGGGHAGQRGIFGAADAQSCIARWRRAARTQRSLLRAARERGARHHRGHPGRATRRRIRLFVLLSGALILASLVPLSVAEAVLIRRNRRTLETLEEKYLTRSSAAIADHIAAFYQASQQQLTKAADAIRLAAHLTGREPFGSAETYHATTGAMIESGTLLDVGMIFFDARLSRDGWFSCHSCHTDGHSNGLLADTLGDGTYGTPKRTLTLRGTALTDPWAWNGSMKYLQDQIEKSLTDTMHAPSFSGEQINDLLSFLHTLPPPPPREPVHEDKADRDRVERGRMLFEQRGCVRLLHFTAQGSADCPWHRGRFQNLCDGWNHIRIPSARIKQRPARAPINIDRLSNSSHVSNHSRVICSNKSIHSTLLVN